MTALYLLANICPKFLTQKKIRTENRKSSMRSSLIMYQIRQSFDNHTGSERTQKVSGRWNPAHFNTVTCRVHILWKAVYHIVRKIFRHKDFWTIQFSAINSHKTFIPLSSSRFIWSTFRCQMCNPPSSCVFNWKKPDKSFVWSLFKVINN